MVLVSGQGILGGRYLLGDELGRGGIGVVYLGYDRRDHRRVAVKVLRSEHTSDPEALGRFEQEYEIARRISHENVARVYQLGKDGDTRYLVLELLGPTLKDLLEARKRLPAHAAAQIACQVLAGLGAAHRVGIVHRDVKPQNVLFAERADPADPLHVKLVDFGIARIASSRSFTVAGHFFGSVHYVSPEQAAGQKVGPPSDVYSTGVLLYQLLTGVVPFDGEDDMAILRRHVEEAPRRPSALAPGIPPRLEAIVLRALEKDPSRRWSGARSMREALLTWDRPPSEWPDEDQTRPVARPSDTQAWTPTPTRLAGAPGGATRAVEATRPARAPRSAPSGGLGRARDLAAPLGFAALILAAVVLGLLLGAAALGATPLGFAWPASVPSAAPTVPARSTPTPSSATDLTLGAGDFRGGCLDGSLPSRLLGGTMIFGQASACSHAVAQFDLTRRPRGAAALILTALASPLGEPEVAVLVNDREVFRGRLDLPRGGGWGTADLSLAESALRVGTNRLEVKNLSDDAQPEVGPWIVLSSADVTWR